MSFLREQVPKFKDHLGERDFKSDIAATEISYYIKSYSADNHYVSKQVVDLLEALDKMHSVMQLGKEAFDEEGELSLTSMDEDSKKDFLASVKTFVEAKAEPQLQSAKDHVLQYASEKLTALDKEMDNAFNIGTDLRAIAPAASQKMELK